MDDETEKLPSDTKKPEVDVDQDGIPDNIDPEIKAIMDHEQFGPSNWGQRRTIIKISLILLAVLYSAVVFAAIAALLYQFMYVPDKQIHVDPNLADLLSTALWTGTFLASTIIGSYVFGASWDTKNFRSSLTTLFEKKKS